MILTDIAIDSRYIRDVVDIVEISLSSSFEAIRSYFDFWEHEFSEKKYCHELLIQDSTIEISEVLRLLSTFELE